MDLPRKRTIGAGALPLVVAAVLVGVPAASADDVCLECVEPGPGQGLNTAFFKLSSLGFPGNTEEAFNKVGGQNAFLKISNLGFPGNTEDVFDKF